MMRPASMFRRLFRDERGVSVIEMGIVAPVLALFVVGIADLSQALSQQFTYQQAVNRSLELAMANPIQGDPADDQIDYSFLVEEAAAAADIDEDRVALDRWLQCDGARQADFTGSCATGQETARYISLSIDEPYTGSFHFTDMRTVATGAVRIQ